MRRRAWLTAPVLFSLWAVSACQRHGRKRIAVIPKGRAHVFWQSVHAGARKAALEADVDLIWNGPASETDFTGQLQILDAMITQRVDAIVLAPIDKIAMVNVVERAAKQGIPVVIFDSGLDTDQFVAQVATDNYAAGVAAAERMGKILNGKGKVAMVMVQAGAASTMAREQGFQDKIQKDFPGIEIVDKRYGTADFAKSLAVTENILTAHPALDALFSSNESTTVGAAQALKARGGNKVRLVGFDSSQNLLEDLTSGVIDSLVVQHPFRMGYDSVKSALEKLNGVSPVKIQNLPPLVVTRENLDDPEVQERVNPPLAKYLP
jgi:ribose transport system substrate-binding protein